MRIDHWESGQRPLIIAEIGSNHEGDLQAAKTMIRVAAASGADAVKFQTYQAQTLVVRSEADRLAQFRRMALPRDAYQELAREAQAHGVMFLSTPFDLEAVDLLDPLVPAFKIASGDLTFTPLLERVAQRGKPILLSTGMSTLDEIREALATIQCAGQLTSSELRDRVILFHCVSSYPLPPEEANLRAIERLRETFGLWVGYSDHTIGILACLAAVALGACVIEKHFTLNKLKSTFRDHQVSADPQDLRALTEGAPTVYAMLGSGEKVPMPSEEANRLLARRSLAARVPIKAGERLSADNVICLRPGTGIAPGQLAHVVGQQVKEDIPAGHLIPKTILMDVTSSKDRLRRC